MMRKPWNTDSIKLKGSEGGVGPEQVKMDVIFSTTLTESQQKPLTNSVVILTFSGYC